MRTRSELVKYFASLWFCPLFFVCANKKYKENEYEKNTKDNVSIAGD